MPAIAVSVSTLSSDVTTLKSCMTDPTASGTPPLNQNSKNGDVPEERLVGIGQWHQYGCQITFS